MNQSGEERKRRRAPRSPRAGIEIEEAILSVVSSPTARRFRRYYSRSEEEDLGAREGTEL